MALLPGSWTVADLGCGTGPALVELAPAVRKVIGVDREIAMAALARSRTRDHDNVEVRVGGLEALPLRNAEVDAAICLLVLHHVEDPSAVFAEIARALKPGGRLVVVELVAHDREDWGHAMGHRHLGFDPAALAEVAARSGLRSASVRGLPPAAEAQGPPLFLATFDRT